MAKDYDVIVIGAGPAGYVAALRCAQLGLKIACVDDWLTTANKPALGGTCLNVGCIPSKALLESSEQYWHALHGLPEHGVRAADIALDLRTMMQRKDKLVRELTQGIEQLFKANRIDWIAGRAQLLANKQVSILEHGKKNARELSAHNVVLAPGSLPVEIDIVPLQADRIVDSSGALAFGEVPERLGIIGAGAIGLELGSVWRRLGAGTVTLLEAQERFLPAADEQLAREALKTFTRQGLDIQLGSRVTASDTNDDGVTIHYENGKGKHQAVFDKVIVAVGRRPNTGSIATEEATLLLDEWGFIHVDDQCRTNLPGVYAIGDAVRGPMLAHKGAEEGVMVAELIAGGVARVNYDAVPSVVYTAPEIAWVGDGEQSLKSSGVDYRSGVFPFAASGRARARGDTGGFIKILAEHDSDRIRGVHMIGPGCSELIAEAVIAMSMGATSEDLALTMFAHPTLSESFHEAALATLGRPLHIFQRKR